MLCETIVSDEVKAKTKISLLVILFFCPAIGFANDHGLGMPQGLSFIGNLNV